MRTVFLLCVGVCFLAVQEVQAMIFIEEILADPPALAGDANGDGTVSTTQDEFVEIFNDTDSPVLLSGWTLADSLKVRHLFPSGSVINGRQSLVVFGGGSPILSSINWQTASGGTLGLNNDGDSVTLKSDLGALIDQAVYGSEGGKDESLTRDPEELTKFILHSQADLALQRKFSPGESLFVFDPVPEDPPQEIPVEEPKEDDPVSELPGDFDPNGENPSTSAVPEPATIICLASGMAAAIWLKKRVAVKI